MAYKKIEPQLVCLRCANRRRAIYTGVMQSVIGRCEICLKHKDVVHTIHFGSDRKKLLTFTPEVREHIRAYDRAKKTRKAPHSPAERQRYEESRRQSAAMRRVKKKFEKKIKEVL